VSPRPRLVGVNHVALEVSDVDEALAFYGAIFDLTHLGLVVDDKDATRRALEEAGAEILPGRGLDFRDPWGNRIQVVDYRDVQFSKTEDVLRGMGLEGLEKSERALAELREKGLGPA
jgi:lactoylglutathione lyase